MPHLRGSAEFVAHLSTERQRVELFLRLTQEGMSAAQALAVIDEEAPFTNVDRADEGPDGTGLKLLA